MLKIGDLVKYKGNKEVLLKAYTFGIIVDGPIMFKDDNTIKFYKCYWFDLKERAAFSEYHLEKINV